MEEGLGLETAVLAEGRGLVVGTLAPRALDSGEDPQ
jgi:hypothetical protein